MSSESIFKSSLRLLFSTLSRIVGWGLGLIFLVVAIAFIFSIEEMEPARQFTLSIVPNREGVRKNFNSAHPAILELRIHGVIGLDSMTQEAIRELLLESREGDLKKGNVKGILLVINSPGGTVVDADGIYRALLDYKKQHNVPIVAYVDGLCASGGMYVACAADEILSSDASIVGSVGVLVPSFVNFSGLMEKVGIKALTLSAGKGKDNLDPLRPWTAGEENNLADIVNYYYHSFVEIVAKSRSKLSQEKLKKDYGAQIYPAPVAAQYGFIDSAGKSREEALQILLTKVSLPSDTQVIMLEKSNWVSQLFSEKTAPWNITVKHEFLSESIPPSLSGHFLYLYTHE